ncbi:hypothetical protein FUAX_37480 [Fulvitalea axinellae]|uniref:HTH araC/xylS-type domain-containing protein n=1 Tax=Fulvitalea axinellae TaxID=1182444 RepID=A0AAU9CGM2_9BACT|nr:hypothetical protein FUAX_37480 [Fulvitalea axinellae]
MALLGKIFFVLATALLPLAETPGTDKIHKVEASSADTVFAIRQDAEGFVWVATSGGVILYGGENQRHFLPGKSVEAVMPFVDGGVLARSAERLYVLKRNQAPTPLQYIPGLAEAPDTLYRRQGAEKRGFALNLERLEWNRGRRSATIDDYQGFLYDSDPGFSGIPALVTRDGADFWCLNTENTLTYLSGEGGGMEIRPCPDQSATMVIKAGFGRLWLARAEGLWEYNRYDDRWKRLRIPDLKIIAMELDASACLWIGTSGQGLWRYDLPLESGAKAARDEMREWWRGDAFPVTDKAPVVIDKAISDTEVSFSVSILTYRSGANPVSRYRLLGEDTLWRRAQGRHFKIAYSNLPAGEYEFELGYKLGAGQERFVKEKVRFRKVSRFSLWVFGISIAVGIVLAFRGFRKWKTQAESPTGISGKRRMVEKDRLFLEEFENALAEELDNVELTVRDLCGRLKVSKSGCYRSVKRVSGLSPSEYMVWFRLKSAERMFGSGERNVGNVADAVGFGSASYFSKCFRKEFGKNPSEYIRELELREA